MLKKLLLLSFAAFTMAACNDEADDGVRYATHNPSIVDGVFTSDNMHFYGTATVTHVSDGSTYTDPKAWFEFAGDRESLTIYMHATRFAAAMPALEMRIHRMPYTSGEGASLSFTAASTVPQVRLPNEVGGGYSYQDMPCTRSPTSRARSRTSSAASPSRATSPGWEPTAWSTRGCCW